MKKLIILLSAIGLTFASYFAYAQDIPPRGLVVFEKPSQGQQLKEQILIFDKTGDYKKFHLEKVSSLIRKPFAEMIDLKKMKLKGYKSVYVAGETRGFMVPNPGEREIFIEFRGGQVSEKLANTLRRVLFNAVKTNKPTTVRDIIVKFAPQLKNVLVFHRVTDGFVQDKFINKDFYTIKSGDIDKLRKGQDAGIHVIKNGDARDQLRIQSKPAKKAFSHYIKLKKKISPKFVMDEKNKLAGLLVGGISLKPKYFIVDKRHSTLKGIILLNKLFEAGEFDPDLIFQNNNVYELKK